MKSILIAILSCLCLVSCNKNQKVAKVERAFYYWKNNENNYGSNNYQLEKLQELQVKKLYIKLFEVDYSETVGNYPYEKSYVTDAANIQANNIEIIPTVFIKNEIFQFNNQQKLEKLADDICFLVNKRLQYDDYTTNTKNTLSYQEIQIDCDWTPSTKDNYFYLLRKIKQKSNKKISCTLRLYPYKFPEVMGVPPVDKTMLMCYNLIKPLSQKNNNSILEISELKKYLNKLRTYPKPIDIALPTFSWTQLYQNNRFERLLNLTQNDFKSFTKPLEPMWFEVTKDTTINYDIYLRAGDRIKYEAVEAQKINEAIAIIKKNVALEKNITISLFDLNETTFNKYSNEEITSFYTAITK